MANGLRRAALGMYASIFDVQGNKVGLGALRGCGGDCGCADCSGGLGALGVTAPNTTGEGEVVSGAAGIGVGAAVTAGVTAVAGGATALIAGVSIGSVAGPIGTVVGAVAGYLTSKLFGHADYASVYAQVANAMSLAQAYISVAGKYPGRVYGWLELQYVWSGLVLYGVFPQNYNAKGCLGTNPGLGVCKQSSLSCNINACGTESWIQDVILGTGTKAIQPQIERANKAGVYNPTQVWSSYIAPVWAGPVECSGCVDWFLPQNARAGYASLVQQLVIDTVDAIEFNANDCLALYYGSIPSGWSCGCAKGCSGVAAPAAAAAAACAPSVPGATIRAGTTSSLCVNGLTFQFSGTAVPDNPGNDYVLVGGAQNGGGDSITWNGSNVVITNTYGATYNWNFSTHAWVEVSAGTATTQPVASSGAAVASTAGGGGATRGTATATAAAPTSTPTLTAVAQGCSVQAVSGSAIQSGSGETLCDPAGNVWSFSSTTQCNTTTCQGYLILLNGKSTNGYANALAYIDGQIVAQNELGSAYWNAGAWASLTSACQSTPSGWSVIGVDTSGNDVYESPSGVLYECQGGQMVMFSGNLDLSSGVVEPAQALQAMIQGDMAAGQSLVLATQNALAAVQETGTGLTPEVTGAVADQVAQTYSAPAAVDSATGEVTAAPATSSTTSDVLIGAGALAVLGLAWWAFAGGHHRRR